MSSTEMMFTRLGRTAGALEETPETPLEVTVPEQPVLVPSPDMAHVLQAALAFPGSKKNTPLD